MRHFLHLLMESPHRLICRISPTYNANAWALDLRARGYDCPPGTILAGVRVTR